MKRLSHIVLLSSGLLLLLTGCVQKIDSLAGKAVSLKVVGNYGAPASRTAYSGEGTWVDNQDHSKGLSWERINWSADDQLLIWGTNVSVRENGHHPDYGATATHIATYSLSNIQKKNDNQSIADLNDKSGLGLRYDDGAASYTFWGIYPADAALGESAPTGNAVSFAIAGEQTVDASGNPDMQQAVMLSVLPNASPTGNNEMEFYPAFTAYQFDITSATDDSFTLKRIKISSANGTTLLWGNVAATIVASGASTYVVSDGGTSITCTPSTALAISDTQHAVLTLFANPNGSEGLKVSFVLGKGDVEIVRTATLKKSGAVMSFAGLKKHIIKGIIVPTDVYFDKITLQLQVQGWDEYTLAEANASDHVQATQFVVSGDATARVKNGRDDLGQGSQKRQYWYFTSGGVVTVSFKVMLPENGTWSVVPSDTENFSVTNVSSGTSSTTLSGSIGNSGTTEVTLQIRYIGEDSDPHQLYLNTFATKNGHTYSLDSETQLFDIRGYHYFVVNDATYLASF